MRRIRTAIGAATINPKLITSAERTQYERLLTREEDNAAILGLAETGLSIREIVRRTRLSLGRVRNVPLSQR